MMADTQKEFVDHDEASIDFSVDPDMYTKLDIRKAKLGEENAFDDEKIYRFQLAKDIKKLERERGAFKTRHARFMEVRELDDSYQKIAFPEMLGSEGRFTQTLPQTLEQSWKSSSQPYGNIANKRYLHYLRNLPKGPTEAEILDKQQRNQDMQLWADIKAGKTELTKRQLREMERQKEKKAMQEIADSQKVDFMQERLRKHRLIVSADFDALRSKPTKREFQQSLEQWHRGVHYPYDFEKGFPIATEVGAMGVKVIRNRDPHESMLPPQQRNPQRFLSGEGAEAAYVRHMVDINFKKALEALRVKRQQLDDERRRAEKESAALSLAQRRGGTLSGFQLQQQAVAAKFALLQKERTIADQPEGAEASHDDSDSDDSSSSDSSGGGSFGGGGGSGRSSPQQQQQHSAPESRSLKSSVSSRMLAPLSNLWLSRSASVLPLQSNESDLTNIQQQQDENGGAGSRSSRKQPPLEVRRIKNSEYTKRKAAFTPTQQRLQKLIRRFNKIRPDKIAYAAFKEIRRLQRSRRHVYYTKPGEMTPGERYKHQQKKLLKSVSERISSTAYHDSLVQLEEHLIPTGEFMKSSKKKSRSLKREIAARAQTARNADDARYIELLQKRLSANEEAISERLRREQVAKERAERILQYIEESQQLLDSLQDGLLERTFKRLRRLRMSKKAKKALQKQQQTAEKHQLPEVDLKQNAAMVEELRIARTAERESEEFWRRQYYRALGVDAYDRIKTPTLEDLVLAVRAGNYVDVLDCVFHTTNPVAVNAVNDDGVTATYTALLMILKREVLDSAAELEDLMAGPLERLAKRLGLSSINGSAESRNDGKMELVLRILIACGGDLDFRKYEQGQDGLAMMHSAAEGGAVDMLQWLLQMGSSVDLRTSLRQRTPLMLSLEFDQLDAAFFLLRNGAMLHLELKDSDGWTALHYAAVYARADLVLFLLICGARVNSRNKLGRLPSEEAQSRGRTEIMSMILTFKSDAIEYLDRLENLMETEQQQYQQYQQQSLESSPLRVLSQHQLAANAALEDGFGAAAVDADDSSSRDSEEARIDLLNEDAAANLPPKFAEMFNAMSQYQQLERAHEQRHDAASAAAALQARGEASSKSSRSAGTFALLSSKLLSFQRSPPAGAAYEDPWETVAAATAAQKQLPRQQTDENGVPLYQRSLQMKRISFYQPPRLVFNRSSSAKAATQSIHGRTTALDVALKQRRRKGKK